MLDPTTHDRAVAAVSHLPHLVADAWWTRCSAWIPPSSTWPRAGFRDTTRIAASSPGDLARDLPGQSRGARRGGGRLPQVAGPPRGRARRRRRRRGGGGARADQAGPGVPGMRIRVRPARRLAGAGGGAGGQVHLPPRRAAGALASGRTEITGFLEGEDCLATLQAVRALGAEVTRKGPGALPGGRGRARSAHRAGQRDRLRQLRHRRTPARGRAGGPALLDRAHRRRFLRSRPMERVAEPLRRMGATVVGRREGSRLPLAVRRRAAAPGAHLRLAGGPRPRSETALLLAGLWAGRAGDGTRAHAVARPYRADAGRIRARD